MRGDRRSALSRKTGESARACALAVDSANAREQRIIRTCIPRAWR
jgi:hypothetical protein